MKLKDIIIQTSWPQVAIALVTAYPDQRKYFEQYSKVFDTLWQMEPAVITTVLHIELLEDDLEPGLYFYHVFGKEPGDENINYGLICCHWEEWLGMELAPDTLTRFTPFEIVAGCLYEMTWAGFDQKKTNAFRKKYFDTVVPNINKRIVDITENLNELKLENNHSMEWLLSDLTRYIRWGAVSKEYFGKNREWFNQHILIDANSSDLDRIDILALKGALREIANKIKNVIEDL